MSYTYGQHGEGSKMSKPKYKDRLMAAPANSQPMNITSHNVKEALAAADRVAAEATHPDIIPMPKPEPDLEVFPRLWEAVPSPQHPTNLHKQLVAQQVIQHGIAAAEKHAIEGNRFHGELRVIVSFQAGIAQDVKTELKFSTR